MSRIANSKWNLFFHYAGLIVNMVSGIFLAPLYIKYVDITLYGYWLAINNIIGWLSVVDPGFSSVIQQKIAYFWGKKDYSKIVSYVFYGFITALFLSIFLLLLGWILSYYLMEILDFNGNTLQKKELHEAFIISIIGTALIVFSYSLGACTIGMQSIKSTGLTSLFVNLTGLVVTIYLITHDVGLKSIGYGILTRGIGYCFMNGGLLLFLLISKKIPIKLNTAGYKSFLKLLSFNYLGSFSSIFLNNINAFLIVRILGGHFVPIFSFTKSAFDICSQLLIRPSLALVPTFSHLIGEGDATKSKQIFLTFLQYLVWLMGCIVSGLFLLNETFVSLWIGANFFGGQLLNTIFCIMLIFSSILASFINFLTTFSAFKFINVILSAQSIIYIPLSILLLHFFFLSGLPIALITSILIFPFWICYRHICLKLDIDWTDNRNILRECLYVSVVIIITSFIFVIFPTQTYRNWLLFLIRSGSIVVIYFSLLLIISRLFRLWVWNSIQKVLNKNTL